MFKIPMIDFLTCFIVSEKIKYILRKDIKLKDSDLKNLELLQ